MDCPKHDIVIIEGARTPVGKFLGGLATVSATELGAFASKEALRRAAVDPGWIDAVYFGNVIQSSKDAAYIARHVGLKAGAPIETPALTVNRACGSGLDAILCGARALCIGEATFVLAGGAENMSMTPYAMRGVRTGWTMLRTDVDDMLFSALHDPMAGCSIAETVEHLAAERGISRVDADRAAAQSQQRAVRAQNDGILAQEITPVEIATRKGKTHTIELDESLRPETSEKGLASLPGMFHKEGIVTAGNSSGLNDAGAAVVMATRPVAASKGCAVLGCLRGWAVVGVPPKLMGLGPIEASRKALAMAGRTIDDMDVIELNDSFTVQYLAVESDLGLDPARVNPNGGAIAIGHPMGATGTRLALSALYELRRTGGRFALCTLCIGGGQGIAAVFERCP